MILYDCRNEQDIKTTFLVIHFCMVVGINKNIDKKGRSNSKFPCIPVMPLMWLGEYLSFLL